MKNSLKIILILTAMLSLSFATKKNKEILVIIDASHGGKDFGSNNKDFSEKAIVASITKKIKDLNSDSEIIIRLTRKDDENLSLLERVNIVNEIKPDLFISLHINNSKNPENSGYEIYVSDKISTFEKSNALANRLINSFSANYPLQNRGLKTAPFLVLKKCEVPSILIELGFLSNEFDRNYITDDQNQNEIAKTILEFIGSLKL
jgi:N-acetylmuramoyl-L-alanine amidase